MNARRILAAMTHSVSDMRFDTSDAALLKRGWLKADVWLAGLLAMVGIASCVIPERLSLSRSLHFQALRVVRRLEALLRRLTLAMAADTTWPVIGQALDRTTPFARIKPVPMTILPFARLGLACHWTPETVDTTSRPKPTRKPAPPVIALEERWYGDQPLISDSPFPPAGACNTGPRLRNFDDPAPLASHDRHARPVPSDARLLKRIVALKAAIACPDRMVQRMTRWLVRRHPRRHRSHRPYPLNIVLPRCPDARDVFETLATVQSIARDRLLRRDSG